MKYYTPTRISENMHETPEGFLICIGVPITRTGELIYGEGETPLETGDDGHVVIDRNESDVFHPLTMASFEGKPVTINHPDDFVDPDNWSDLARGTLQNIRRGKDEDKNSLLADVLITDAMAIGLVKNGLREVSCGYEAEYIQTGKGKGRQTKIVGNHLALVEKGRAGPTCAINDHKGKEITTMSKLAELIKKLSKVADEEMPEKKDDKSKDEKESEKKDDKKDDKKSEDASAYDELVQVCNALIEKINGMKEKKSGDEDMSEKKDDKKDDKKADDEDVSASLEDRLKALETAVAKMLESESTEEMGDEDEMEEEESEDDDFEESSMTGDELSRAEILAPGIKQSKDIKAKALKIAYGTKEGKGVIDSLTANKPTFDSADKVDTLFIAVSEILKAKRTNDFSKTKQAKDSDDHNTIREVGDSKHAPMTPEKMNELNAAHWAKR